MIRWLFCLCFFLFPTIVYYRVFLAMDAVLNGGEVGERDEEDEPNGQSLHPNPLHDSHIRRRRRHRHARLLREGGGGEGGGGREGGGGKREKGHEGGKEG